MHVFLEWWMHFWNGSCKLFCCISKPDCADVTRHVLMVISEDPRKGIQAWKASEELSSDLGHHHFHLGLLVKAGHKAPPSLLPHSPPDPKDGTIRRHVMVERPQVILQRVILHWGRFEYQSTTLLFQGNCYRAMKWWWSITIIMVHTCFHFCFPHAFIHPTFRQGFAREVPAQSVSAPLPLHAQPLLQCVHLGRWGRAFLPY